METASRPAPRVRIASFDTIRVAAILAVMAAHTLPFTGPSYRGAGIQLFAQLLNLVWQFAVPYFLATAGYFYGRKLLGGAALWPTFAVYCKRIAFMLVLWVAIHQVIWAAGVAIEQGSIGAVGRAFWAMLKAAPSDPNAFAFQMIRYHMWFLVFLMPSLFGLTVLLHFRWDRYVLPMAVVLYVLALLVGEYHRVFGIPYDLRAVSRSMFYTLFLVFGWWYARREAPGLGMALAVMVGGLVLQWVEGYLLHCYYGTDIWGIHYILGTVPLGFGSFMVALAWPNLGRGTFLARWGGVTLGVYVCHVVFLDMVRLIFLRLLPQVGIVVPNPWWQIGFPLLVYMTAVGFTLLVSKSSYTRWLVAW